MRTALLLAPFLAFVARAEPLVPQDAPPAPLVRVPSYPNTTCPIMGKPISSRLFVDTDKGRFWVCCKGCNEEILLDLETAHRAAYPVVKRLELERCPITHEPLPEEPATIVLQGFEIPLCCAPCAADMRRDSQIVLALLLEPELEDLANPRCPVDDEPVVANAFCVIDGVLVRLSDPRHVEPITEKPREHLERARAIVAEHGALKRPACPEREKAAGEEEDDGRQED